MVGSLSSLRLTRRDRLMGGLLGLVVGDALGVPVEFSLAAERRSDPVRGMRAWGTHLQPRGAWSDDGALALAHAAAFVVAGWNPRLHIDAFEAWHRSGAYTAHGRAFDIGEATRKALERHRRGTPLAQVGSAGVFDNGNGSLMRILPASLWWLDESLPDRVALAGEASALTHAHPRSRLACAWYGEIAAGILAGRCLTEILPAVERELTPFTPEAERLTFRHIGDTTVLDQDPRRMAGEGYVVTTLGTACWCLHRGDDYASTVLQAVNLGGDTDTNAAVAGGLAGLRWGFSGIPRSWIAALPRRRWLMDLCGDFADACLSRQA